jgi:hypothetical protein
MLWWQTAPAVSILGPIFEGLKIRAFLDDRKYQQDVRDRQRKEYMLEMEDRRRQRAIDLWTATLAENPNQATSSSKQIVGDLHHSSIWPGNRALA